MTPKQPGASFKASAADPAVTDRLTRIGAMLDGKDVNGAVSDLYRLGNLVDLAGKGHAETIKGLLDRLPPAKLQQMMDPSEFEVIERASAQSAGRRVQEAGAAEEARKRLIWATHSFNGQT
jgi:hypothetical protein